jgi:cysteinyl-tRNA synthetase
MCGTRGADNIDTRSAMERLREVVGAAHVFARNAPRPAPALAHAARYVTDVLHVFGAIDGPRGGIGFPVGDLNGANVTILKPFPLQKT